MKSDLRDSARFISLYEYAAEKWLANFSAIMSGSTQPSTSVHLLGTSNFDRQRFQNSLPCLCYYQFTDNIKFYGIETAVAIIFILLLFHLFRTTSAFLLWH